MMDDQNLFEFIKWRVFSTFMELMSNLNQNKLCVKSGTYSDAATKRKCDLHTPMKNRPNSMCHYWHHMLSKVNLVHKFTYFMYFNLFYAVA